MRPTILVTGGAGYIGCHACKALAGAGYLPVVYDNLCRGQRSAVKWGPLEAHDLSDGRALRAVLAKHEINTVMHFAEYAYVGESMEEPCKYFRNNVANTLTLLEAMLDVGVTRIVYSSTCATYGMLRLERIPEDHPQHPVNPYGEGKLFVERALRWYGEAYGLGWTALRYFNAAGADPDGEIGEDHQPETHLIPLVIQAALGQRPDVEIYGTDYPTPDNTAIRDYIHVTDLAEAHVRALEYLMRGGRSTAFNLGTGRGHSVRDVIRAVERASGRPVPTREAPRRPGDPPVLVADASKAVSVLGLEARYSDLDTIVRTAFDWHRSRATAGRAALTEFASTANGY